HGEPRDHRLLHAQSVHRLQDHASQVLRAAHGRDPDAAAEPGEVHRPDFPLRPEGPEEAVPGDRRVVGATSVDEDEGPSSVAGRSAMQDPQPPAGDVDEAGLGGGWEQTLHEVPPLLSKTPEEVRRMAFGTSWVRWPGPEGVSVWRWRCGSCPRGAAG